jgi:hypothetical protein
MDGGAYIGWRFCSIICDNGKVKSTPISTSTVSFAIVISLKSG